LPGAPVGRAEQTVMKTQQSRCWLPCVASSRMLHLSAIVQSSAVPARAGTSAPHTSRMPLQKQQQPHRQPSRQTRPRLHALTLTWRLERLGRNRLAIGMQVVPREYPRAASSIKLVWKTKQVGEEGLLTPLTREARFGVANMGSAPELCDAPPGARNTTLIFFSWI
jgi:hypothetical protein